MGRLGTCGIVAALLLAGCDGLEGTEDPLAGPCVHLFLDEVLHVDAASGALSGAIVSQVYLSSFAVDGVERDAETILRERSANVHRVNDKLRCDLPCSFGIEAGRWEFFAVAPGYQLTAQVVDASYSTLQGGCPSYNDQGTHTSISLNEHEGN